MFLKKTLVVSLVEMKFFDYVVAGLRLRRRFVRLHLKPLTYPHKTLYTKEAQVRQRTSAILRKFLLALEENLVCDYHQLKENFTLYTDSILC
jgi:hypothetical protein